MANKLNRVYSMTVYVLSKERRPEHSLRKTTVAYTEYQIDLRREFEVEGGSAVPDHPDFAPLIVSLDSFSTLDMSPTAAEKLLLHLVRTWTGFLGCSVTYEYFKQSYVESMDFVSSSQGFFPDELPSYADMMELDDWINTVKSGACTNDDGHGYWSDGKRMGRTTNVFDLENIPEGATHVAWFNK